MKKLKFNAVYIGLIIGLLVTFVTLLCFYFFRNVEDSFITYLRVSYEYAILPKLISLAAISNALLFFIFIWTNRLRSARGVIFSLLICCICVLIIKIIS